MRSTPLGRWMILPSATLMVILLVVLTTLVMQFRRRLLRIAERLFCYDPDSQVQVNFPLVCNASGLSGGVIIVGLFILFAALYLLVASSALRRTFAQIIFPVLAIWTAFNLYFQISRPSDPVAAPYIVLVLSLVGLLGLSIFWVFFEVVPKDASSALKDRWLSYWKIKIWDSKYPDIGTFVIFRSIVLGLVKFAYLDALAIRCFECSKPYFYKSVFAINPMAEKCENCGFSTKGWAEARIREAIVAGDREDNNG